MSYVMCLNDWRCTDRFFMRSVDSSKRHFMFMFDRFMNERALTQYNKTDIERHPGLWVEIMCGASFCGHNEIYVSGKGCICENGKKCGVMTNDDGMTQENIVAIVFLLCVGWLVWDSARSQKETRTEILKAIKAPVTNQPPTIKFN